LVINYSFILMKNVLVLLTFATFKLLQVNYEFFTFLGSITNINLSEIKSLVDLHNYWWWLILICSAEWRLTLIHILSIVVIKFAIWV
jgi:hypothetical protein